MGDDRHWRHLLLMHQLGDVVDVVHFVIARASRPFAVAMAAQVGGDDVIAALEPLHDPIPVAAVVAPAVGSEHGRRALVAPVDRAAEAQPLREVEVRSRSGHFFSTCERHATSLRRYRLIAPARHQAMHSSRVTRKSEAPTMAPFEFRIRGVSLRASCCKLGGNHEIGNTCAHRRVRRSFVRLCEHRRTRNSIAVTTPPADGAKCVLTEFGGTYYVTTRQRHGS